MSRAFVKESDFEQAGDDYAERPQSPHPNYVTPRGLRLLRERAEQLAARRAALAADSDDPAARQEIAQIERDLRYFNGRLERALPVDPATQPADRVHFGARVSVEDEEGETREFTIVGEDEADAAAGLVSWVSPLAVAMMRARVGDTVVWRRPAGDQELTILAIAPGTD